MSASTNPKAHELRKALNALGPEGKMALYYADQILEREKQLRYMFVQAKKISKRLKILQKYTEEPVRIAEFVESPDYLNQPNVLYPPIMEEIQELNSGKYVEAVLTGGIGVGKTTIALFTTAYQLYLLSIMRDPHKDFGISPTDEIVFVFQSISSALAKAVDFSRFKELVSQSPYFINKFRFDVNYASELRFPKRIIVKPVSGQSTAAIGQNVIGGVLDEVNFMAVIEASKTVKDGGLYDQAWENYRAIVRRRESRFMVQGKLPGMLCLVSSKQYPGEFTDVKIKEAKTNPRIFVYDKRLWEVKPADSFSGEWFRVFTGTETNKPRILEDDEQVLEHQAHLVMRIPGEYKHSFESDILSSLRDIGGISTLALHPFFTDTESVAAAFGRTSSILSREGCDFQTTKLMVLPTEFRKPRLPRFVHLDLAISGDSAGVACGYVDGFVDVPRGPGITETLPNIVFDFVLEVSPPKNGEIHFYKIRELLYRLRELGLNTRWATLDTFQSTDMIQILRQQGFQTGIQSVDTTTAPYDVLKTALYDKRVFMPKHALAQMELVRLEREAKKNKIDHPANGSKDCADAMAGVVYGLTMRRSVWLDFGIPLNKIPKSLLHVQNTDSNSLAMRAGEGRLGVA